MHPAAFLVLFLALAAGSAGAAPARPRLAQVPVAGHAYLPLQDWARANGLSVRWLKRDATLELNGHGATLRLNIDSREIQINHVAVWLSYPIIARNGTVLLSRLDADTALRPFLFPPRNPVGVRVVSICLDPGHGGKDPGFCFGVNQEKKYNLLLAKELRPLLERAGFKVSFTRTADKFIDLDMRPDIAQRRHADLFVSLHFNAAETGRQSVQGAQVFCLTPPGASSTNARGEGGGAGSFPGNRNNDRNLLVAYEVQRALLRELAVEDRGVRRARFAVLREATMPAVLIEAGFMSHPVEGRKIFSTAYREKLARAILDGILAYKRTVEPKT